MRTDLETDVLILLREVACRARANADRRARKYGMTRAQWGLLWRIERHPGLSQNELAAIVQVAPITVAHHVDRLEALGLVERCGDPEDRRVWRLQLTPAAAPVLRAGKHSRTTPDELIVKGVDSAALRAMVVGLARMKENLVSGGPGTTHRTRRVKISRWKIGRRSLCPQAVRHV